jgi:hypothetical protein
LPLPRCADQGRSFTTPSAAKASTSASSAHSDNVGMVDAGAITAEVVEVPLPSDAGSVAVMVVVPAVTPVIVNVADVAPVGMITEAGTVAMPVLAEERVMVVGDPCAVPMVTVPFDVVPANPLTGIGETVMVGSGAAEMFDVAVAELFPGTVSVCAAETVAVLLTEPAVLAVTVIEIVALAPAASVPTLHVTVEVPLQLPWLAVDETKVVPAGSVSVTVTLVAGALLVLVTLIWNVMLPPTETTLGEIDLLMATTSPVVAGVVALPIAWWLWV